MFLSPKIPSSLDLLSPLSRPEGNLTRINFFIAELVAKRLELLRELVPAMAHVAVFVNPANPATCRVSDERSAIRGARNGIASPNLQHRH